MSRHLCVSVLLVFTVLSLGWSQCCFADDPTTVPTSGAKGSDSFVPDAHAASTYFVIPIHDEIGVVTTADMVKKMLAQADRVMPSIVILDVNSPGGMVSACDDITDLLIKWQTHSHVRVVSFVSKSAFSAAAVISMSSHEIYMVPNSTIGAAMIVLDHAKGWDIYNDPNWNGVTEKMASAYRAQDRAVVEFGGHDPLLLEGMSSTNIELWMAKDKDGKPKIYRGPDTGTSRRSSQFNHTDNGQSPDGAPLPPANATLFLKRGKILTLTGEEAVACGLANGEVDDLPMLLTTLGLSGATEASNVGIKLIDQRSHQVDTLRSEFLRHIQVVSRSREQAYSVGNDVDLLSQKQQDLQKVLASISRIRDLVRLNPWLLREDADSFDTRLGSVKTWVESTLSSDQRTIDRLTASHGQQTIIHVRPQQ